jgi:hypothetical protein
LGDEEARLRVEQLISRRQELCPGRSNWTLDLLRAACAKLLVCGSRGAFKRALSRLKISYQRARTYFHSPDAAYEAKLAYLSGILASHKEGVDTVLFEDELTYYNHASPGPDHAPQRRQPKAGLAVGGERSWRVAGALDVFSGEFTSVQRSAVTVPAFVAFLKEVAQRYAGLEVVYLVVDNWPVHFHPDVIEALRPQQCPYPYPLPAAWRDIKPSGKYASLQLNIELVPLPTYASWLNPVEKVWKWLKRELLHNHAFAGNFNELKELVGRFLIKVKDLGHIMLSAVGLRKPNGIFAEQLRKAGINLPTLKC